MSDPGLQVQRADARFRTAATGIDSRHVFSFGAHYDPGLVGHGPLVVLNEETVQTGRGFDDHPHADAEILTWVLSGSLQHADSTGHRGVVVPGLAQRLSAGSGVVHAERNDAYRTDPGAPRQPVRFVQMWLRPDQPGGPPRYEQGAVDLAGLAGQWQPVASGSHPDAAVGIGTAGATLWVTRLAPGTARSLPVGPLSHLYVARGEVDLEGVGPLATGDSVAMTGDPGRRLTGRRIAEVLVWTLPAAPPATGTSAVRGRA